MLKETGEKVAVISRGYGRRSREPVQVVSDGAGPLASYPDASDEAMLCAQTLEGLPVISAPGRTEAIRTARDTFGASVALLDDGFSHLAAGRDKNILLLDAVNPFGNGQMLPAGPLREPLSSIARADAVIITRAGAATPERIVEIKKDVKSRAHGGIPVFTCDINAEDVIDPGGARHAAKKFLNGRRVCLLSGIASPEQFEQMVKKLCSSITEHFAYEDHHRFTDEEIKTLLDDKPEGSLLLTTEKDFIRLPAFAKKVAHRLTISAKINEEEPGDFIKYLLL
jgi:tetraacyldisaccharide 4'-kinase